MVLDVQSNLPPILRSSAAWTFWSAVTRERVLNFPSKIGNKKALSIVSKSNKKLTLAFGSRRDICVAFDGWDFICVRSRRRGGESR